MSADMDMQGGEGASKRAYTQYCRFPLLFLVTRTMADTATSNQLALNSGTFCSCKDVLDVKGGVRFWIKCCVA